MYTSLRLLVKKEYEVALSVSYKNNIFSKVRRLQGAQNMTELDVRWKDCSLHIFIPDKPGPWSIPKQTKIHAITDFWVPV